VTTTLQDRSSNGHVATRPMALDSTHQRRVRIPELAVGVLVVAGCALGAVLWQASAVERDAVLALRNDVSRGEAVSADDLRVVYVSSDDPIGHVAEGRLADVVGRVAATDLPAGTLLSPALLVAGAAVEPGQGVVGLALEPGQVPTATLRAGDVVNVVAGGTDIDNVLAQRAEVYAIEELPTEGRVFVSLAMPETDANAVATAAEAGPVRLVLVAR
jgi:hypothetical protein